MTFETVRRARRFHIAGIVGRGYGRSWGDHASLAPKSSPFRSGTGLFGSCHTDSDTRYGFRNLTPDRRQDRSATNAASDELVARADHAKITPSFEAVGTGQFARLAIGVPALNPERPGNAIVANRLR